jgi:phosphopantetheine adenylyltransferase
MAEPPRFLLFIPPPPSPPSLSSLKSAFGDTISQVLKEVASHSADTPDSAAILDIALAIPELAVNVSSSRSQLFNSIQAVVAAVYDLICVIAVQQGIDIEDSGGVDVRVLLMAWSLNIGGSQARSGPYGPVIDIHTLAQSGRQWQYAFGVESEAGEAMVKAFMAAKGSSDRVQGGSVVNVSAGTDIHHHVAVGGTFDHLHIGHKLLLTMTLFAVDDDSTDIPRSATIGITGDKLLVNKKYAEVLESWPHRQKSVQQFVDSILNFTSHPPPITYKDEPGPNGKSIDIHYPNNLTVKCTEIQDPFGPTITDQSLTALIISAETRSGGKAVNDKRAEKRWNHMKVLEVAVLDGEEGGKVNDGFKSKISSTAIREKLISKKR